MNTIQLRTRVVGSAVLLMSMLFLDNSAYSQQAERIRIDIQTLFTQSGWMGDGEYGRKYIDFSGANSDNPHSPPTAIKITYTFGPTRWGGIYWQNEPDNWGDKPGTNYTNRGLSKITFWARGETGTEVVEFKAGGIESPRKKYRDSFRATIGRVTLSKEWRQYQIDLSNADLSSVIGGFGWVASADYNPTKKLSFFLDDMFFE
jgi:hypothetical protein